MKDLVKVCITHDGKGPAFQTKVTEVETGREIVFLRKVLIDINPSNMYELIHATVQFSRPKLDLLAYAHIQEVCPCCGSPREEKEDD
jgi:hypothetical protein